MAKPEGEIPNPEKPILGNGALTPAEPAAETETPVAEAAPVESQPEEAWLTDLKSEEIEEEIKSEEAEPEKPESEKAEAEKAEKENWDEELALKKKKAAMLYLKLSGVIGIPLLFIALGHFQFLGYPVAVVLCVAVLMAWGLWASRKTNTVYTVFLGLTVIALLAAVCCLWTELVRYEGDIRASKAKQRTTMSAPSGCAADVERYV